MGVLQCGYFFFFKQKTAYEMRISDWSSDVCSSDLKARLRQRIVGREKPDLAGHMIAGRNGNPFFRTGEANAHPKTLVMLMEQFNILFDGIAEPVQPHIVGPPIFVGEAIEKALVVRSPDQGRQCAWNDIGKIG